jgi:uncharacterized protein with NRDE domain
MCLIATAFLASERYPLIVAANRDERHERPSAAADWWPEQPRILGGRDLVAGGGWLAVDRSGRLAAVTNFAEPETLKAELSRGGIVADFLATDDSPAAYSAALAERAHRYGPFNALVYDGAELVYLSNRFAGRALPPGVHALGNGPLGADWPKIRRLRDGLGALVDGGDPTTELFALLAERAPPSIADSRRLAPFIVDERFGTRSSTVLSIDADGRAVFAERRFDGTGAQTGESRFEFELDAAPPDRWTAGG